jgi:diguanylate cyclase (GGDEF)-like protein
MPMTTMKPSTATTGVVAPPPKVLLVEPSEPERTRLAGVLAAGGLEVHACADADAAEGAAIAAPPGLILARWDLPGSGGIELIHRLAAACSSGWMPVILYGTGMPAEARVAALELGALDVLTTTPEPDELLARIRAGLRLRARVDHLERRAYRDDLTGLINRGAVEDQLLRHWEASRRYGTSLAVLIVDVDRLKEINDTFGHPAGDAALRRTAAALSQSIRLSDVVARYGGDEFLVIAPACSPASAVPMTARFRVALSAPPDPASAVAAPPGLTLSVGIAGTDVPPLFGIDELIDRADRALYLAKRSGRDAVALFEPDRDEPALVDGSALVRQ